MATNNQHWIHDFAPYTVLKNTMTGEIKRFEKTSLIDTYKLLEARRAGWVYDDELSAKSEDEDNG